jgi:P27 family predicted phage terminase small subunit
MGRRPNPTAKNKLRGFPGHRPPNPDEPKPEILIPDPPDHLGDIALAEWASIAPKLKQLGLLTEIDGTALAAYCACYERWVRAETELTSLVVTFANGNEIQSPLIGIANKALLLMHKYIVEFGMTPAARSRVTLRKDGKPKGEWDGFEKGG